MFRAFIASAAAAIAALTLGAVAFAASPNAQQPLTVDCGSQTFDVLSVPGNGQFTPVHVVGGGTLIPVAFTDQVATFTDNEGNVTTESVPDVSHPAPANQDLMSCSFSATFTNPDGTFTFSGDVTAFEAPPQS